MWRGKEGDGLVGTVMMCTQVTVFGLTAIRANYSWTVSSETKTFSMKTVLADPRWRIGKREGEVMKQKQPHFTNVSFLPFRKTSLSLAQVHFTLPDKPLHCRSFQFK